MTRRKTRGKPKMNLADFLAEKLKHNSYRELAAKIKVSRGALEAIVKQEATDFPKLGTLNRIAQAYGKPLWEVVEMAGADLNLPQNDTNRARRLAQLVARQPRFETVAKRLIDKIDTNPEYVDGIIAAIEAAMNELPDESPQ
jgi:transcriptional regulator with XRE-family HTH domain